jgi:hypothetical protein
MPSCLSSVVSHCGVPFSHVRTISGAHPALIQWVPGAISPWIKRLGREPNHSPPTSAEVKTKFHIHYPTNFHSVVLNQASMGAANYTDLYTAVAGELSVYFCG